MDFYDLVIKFVSMIDEGGVRAICSNDAPYGAIPP